MKLTVIAQGWHSDEWPLLSITVNNKEYCQKEIQNLTEFDIDINLLEENNSVSINYINKQEHHTKFENNSIVSDQYVEIKALRLDDILLDSWVLTEGTFYPNYFDGFLQQCPDAATNIRSQLIWHFPGKFILPALPSESNFWLWYRHQRRNIHVTHYSQGNSAYREEAYIGSLDSHKDIVEEIKKIINV